MGFEFCMPTGTVANVWGSRYAQHGILFSVGGAPQQTVNKNQSHVNTRAHRRTIGQDKRIKKKPWLMKVTHPSSSSAAACEWQISRPEREDKLLLIQFLIKTKLLFRATTSHQTSSGRPQNINGPCAPLVYTLYIDGVTKLRYK